MAESGSPLYNVLMKKRFWMSFDLGLDGAYDDLYVWLDKIKAVECGDTTCSFQLDIGKKDPAVAVLAAFKKHKIKLKPKDRIYLVWRINGSMTGKFIHGNRRRAPWTGCFVQSAEESEDSDE
jgi:hypothetical protein